MRVDREAGVRRCAPPTNHTGPPTCILLLKSPGEARAQGVRQGARLADEVKYHLPGEPGVGLTAPLVPSVFPGEGTAPITYGAFHLEAGDASGAWVSSTVDLLRFLAGVDDRANRPHILSAGLVAEMTGNGLSVCASGACYYPGGWLVRPTQGDATWSHGGSLPATRGAR